MMPPDLEFSCNQASAPEILEHLALCDSQFVPPLSSRVQLHDYTTKIINRSLRFEAWVQRRLVGFVAAYCNDQLTHKAFITHVSVLSPWTGHGIAAMLLKQCIDYAKTHEARQIGLEVGKDNQAAINLYKKFEFNEESTNNEFVTMKLNLTDEAKHEQSA